MTHVHHQHYQQKHRDLLKSVSDRRLRVISDVSCDPNSDNNPLPIYDAITRYGVHLRIIKCDHIG